MTRRRIQARWYPLAFSYFQNGKVRDAGPWAALIHLYSIAQAHVDSGRDDGAFPAEQWCPIKIRRWLGVMASVISDEEIRDGMEEAEGIGLVERIDDDLIAPHDFAAFSVEVKRSVANEARRKQRESKKARETGVEYDA